MITRIPNGRALADELAARAILLVENRYAVLWQEGQTLPVESAIATIIWSLATHAATSSRLKTRPKLPCPDLDKCPNMA